MFFQILTLTHCFNADFYFRALTATSSDLSDISIRTDKLYAPILILMMVCDKTTFCTMNDTDRISRGFVNIVIYVSIRITNLTFPLYYLGHVSYVSTFAIH